jgi:hypothetical protein
MNRSTLSALLVAALLAGCSEPATTALQPISRTSSVGVTDPTATWKIPVNDAALSLKSDGQFSDGVFSIYADGVCKVSAKIFATTALSNTGDATIQTSAPKGNGCGRRFRLVYPGGESDFFDTFSNLNKLQSSISVIAVGNTEPRRLILGTVPRCGRVIFGDNGNVGAGTDMLNVKRVDLRTWHVQSGAAGADRALCENALPPNNIYNLQVSFDVVASRDMP